MCWHQKAFAIITELQQEAPRWQVSAMVWWLTKCEVIWVVFLHPRLLGSLKAVLLKFQGAYGSPGERVKRQHLIQ